MAKEWKQICKDCGNEFGYSDISLQKDLRKGLSRAERCDECRKKHALEIKSIASSHFALKPRKSKPSILGYPFLGKIDHGERVLKEIYKHPDSSGMDIGLKENHVKQIYEALEQNQVLVIVAPTGTGKSTYLPSKFIDPLDGYPIDYFTKKGPIIVTQPRIPAARDIPKTIGKLVGSSIGPGFDIGFRHGDRTGKKRGENYDKKRNRLIFVTDGSLINWLEEGQIGEFSMIIVDEAHERSCNIDLILGLVKRELLKYPHLKFIIASATIDADSFVNYFSDSTTIKLFNFSDCQKSFGYEEFPWKLSELKKEEFSDSLTEQYKEDAKSVLKKYERTVADKLSNKIVELLNTTDKGGILGFLHGEEHINRAAKLVTDRIKGRKDIKVFPLYTGLGTDKIQAALDDIKERRVLIATNIAETSLTVRDVIYVVDSGLIKQSDWNSTTCRQALNTKFHSKDGCKQRWGRAGRVQKGFVYKLYSKEEFVKYFPSHTPPEIKRSNAESMILGAMASGVNDIENFSMLEKPEKVELERAIKVVKKRGIVDKDFDFTEDGREIYRLSKALSSVLDKVEYNSTQRALDVASFLIQADRYSCLIEAVTAICMMPRMGNALYWAGDGLLKWNKDLNLISKDYQIRLLDSFKSGCIDDLDFACKLYSLYEGCFFDQKLGDSYKNWFAKEYSLNLENFKLLNETRGNLIEVFSQGKKTNTYRPLDLKLVSRIRILASLAWPDRIVSIKKEDNILFESKEYNIKGTISENCAGDWGNEKKAIIGILDQNENNTFMEGKKVKIPVANFLIKYVELVPSNNVIDVINSFRNYSSDISSINAYSNLVSDLDIPINRRVKVDTTVKPFKIKSSFILNKQNSSSNNHDELFIGIYHTNSNEESKSAFEVEIDKELRIKNEETLILEKWVKKNNKVIGFLDRFSNYNATYFDNLKIGDKVEAIIKRPIYNVRNNGLREIIGFIISIAGFHYSLPIENISIELENDSIKELVGQKMNLIKTGVIASSNLPVFSIVPLIEKEREELINLNEVKGYVTKITSQGVYFHIIKEKGQFSHLVSIPTYFIKDNMKYMEIGSEVTIKVRIKNENGEKISVDCLDDEDLSFDEIDAIKDLLRKIKSDKSQYPSFTNHGIEINETELVTSETISFEHFNQSSHSYPIISYPLRTLYAKSWELKGSITGIKKAFDELYLEVSKMKSDAKKTHYLTTQEKLKEFKWHTVKLSEIHKTVIKGEIDKIWDITWKLKNIENQRNFLRSQIIKLSQTPQHQTRNILWLQNKIAEVERDIALLEAGLETRVP